MNKVIALDIDGVLNNRDTPVEQEIGWYVGIDDELVKKLARIVEATGADIVLISTWKYDYLMGTPLGEYLANKLNKYNLLIEFVSEETRWENRGKDLINSLDKYYGKDNYNYVILDDECFDYFLLGIGDHWVHTAEAFGLTDRGVERAISILNCV